MKSPSGWWMFKKSQQGIFWVFLGITIPGCTVLAASPVCSPRHVGLGLVRQLFSSSVSSVPRLKLWMKLDKTFYFKKDLLGISGKPLCLRSIIIFCFYPVLFVASWIWVQLAKVHRTTVILLELSKNLYCNTIFKVLETLYIHRYSLYILTR